MLTLYLFRFLGMMNRALRCLFIIPFWFVPLSKRFECLVLALALIINLVENCVENRAAIMDSMAAQKELGFCVKVSQAAKKVIFLMAVPFRRGGGDLKKKRTFFSQKSSDYNKNFFAASPGEGKFYKGRRSHDTEI